MLGPSQSALIQLGARFPPCMKDVQGVPVTTQLACVYSVIRVASESTQTDEFFTGLNDTANPPDQICPLEDICGFGGFHNSTPNQWFRQVN